GVDSFALQNISGRYRLATPLVGHRALYDSPMDAADEVVLGCVDYILKTAIDHRFEGVEARLRSFARRIAGASLPPILVTWRTPPACRAVRRAPVMSCRSSLRRRPVIAATAAARAAALRASVWRRTGPRRSRLSAFRD